MEKCAQCGSQSNLRRCTGCLETWYCSRECQTKDWSQHKIYCKESPTTKTTTKKDRKAAARRAREEARRRAAPCVPKEETEVKESDEKTFSRKKTNRTTCAEESDSHARETAEAKTDGASPAGASCDPSGENGDVATCEKCKKTGTDMKKCGRCREVTYCSRDCQRADWSSHKVTCQATEAIVTDGYRQMQEQERAERSANDVFHDLRRNLMAQLLGDYFTTSQMTWGEARSRAARAFPGLRVVERFAELGGDFGIFAQFTMGPALVCRIKGPYPHLFRHARLLEDIEGNELHVIFYNEEPPWPYFEYHQLREGNFICINDARIHYFLDGTVGFRIDDPSDVRIFGQ